MDNRGTCHFMTTQKLLSEQVQSTNSWRASAFLYYFFACFALFVFCSFAFFAPFAFFVLFISFINRCCLGGIFVLNYSFRIFTQLG